MTVADAGRAAGGGQLLRDPMACRPWPLPGVRRACRASAQEREAQAGHGACILPPAIGRCCQMTHIPGDPPIGVIASRVIAFDGRPRFQVRMGRPTLAPKGDLWFRAHEIVGPLTGRKERLGAVDAMPALANALGRASVGLGICAKKAEGRCPGRTRRGMPACPRCRNAPRVRSAARPVCHTAARQAEGLPPAWRLRGCHVNECRRTC